MIKAEIKYKVIQSAIKMLTENEARFRKDPEYNKIFSLVMETLRHALLVVKPSCLLVTPVRKKDKNSPRRLDCWHMFYNVGIIYKPDTLEVIQIYADRWGEKERRLGKPAQDREMGNVC